MASETSLNDPEHSILEKEVTFHSRPFKYSSALMTRKYIIRNSGHECRQKLIYHDIQIKLFRQINGTRN